MAKTAISTIIVVLALKQSSIPAFVDRVTAILNAMAANKVTFPAPVPSLAQVTSDLAKLSAAQAAFKAHTGSHTDRDDAVKPVVAAMSQLHSYVEALANANPVDAATIAGDAAMTLRKKPVRTKAPLTVKQTVSSVVSVVAKATKGAKANEWQYSLDGGKTWIDVPATSKATTTIHNLTPGVSVMYRQRVLLTTGLTDWSQPISALVT